MEVSMRLGRFSIAGLMGLVLIAALGFGGLKAATPLLASIYYSLALLALVTGVLVAIQSRGPKRSFFVGFSVVGWVYFSFTFVFPSGSDYVPPPQLLPALLLDKAESWFVPQNNFSITGTLTGTVTGTLPVGPVVPPPPGLPPTVPASVVTMSTPSINGTATTASFSLPTNAISFSSTGAVVTTETASFHYVGQSMTTLLLAYFGGLFSLFLAARRERAESTPTPDVSPSSP
jgi:hypothetical protein